MTSRDRPAPPAAPAPQTGTAPPDATAAPAPSPTAAPAPNPTAAPSPNPTAAPAPSTTAAPAPSPTAAPSPSTTAAPAPSPTAAPSPNPTAAPSPNPTAAPAPNRPGADPPNPAGEEPLLPASYDENDLRSAVGASSRTEPLAPPRTPRNKKTLVASVLSIVAGLGIVALVVLGRANSGRYLLVCEAARAVAEQGRAFPPWGTQALGGDAWKPLAIAPETRCQPHETDDLLALQRRYLAMILDQATGLLTAREVTELDDAEALLKQALLLTRPPAHEPEPLASERSEHRKETERMLGDVTYWRAWAKLRDARAALTDAAKQFDSAAAQHPRHVSDASAWAAYARKLAQDLHAGPAGTRSPAPPAASPAASAPPTAPPAERPNAPAGVALPVEPGAGSAGDPPAAPAPPDAGVPTGGVLL